MRDLQREDVLSVEFGWRQRKQRVRACRIRLVSSRGPLYISGVNDRKSDMSRTNPTLATLLALLFVVGCSHEQENEENLASAPAVAAVPQPEPVTITEEKEGLITLARIRPDAARSTALAALPGGRVIRAELEQTDGKLIYSFDILAPGSQSGALVQVDAKTGELIKAVNMEKKASK
jgi:peptidase YpeB-like protein